MAKRRFNTKQIAKQPLLKKRMAKFCSYVEIKYSPVKPNYEEILTNGHRGYISYSEDDLAKEFDKKLNILRDKYNVMKAQDDKNKIEQRWYRQSEEFVDITLWYEEAVEIANEIFEEQFLA